MPKFNHKSNQKQDEKKSSESKPRRNQTPEQSEEVNETDNDLTSLFVNSILIPGLTYATVKIVKSFFGMK